MLISLTIAGGLILLAAGGELLVRGSAQIAARFGVSSLVIGLTIVAFGTSAPEVAVSLQSISSGASDLAVRNVLGSNIFNVLFILGASAVVVPLVVSRRVVWIEVPVAIGVSTLAWCSARDGRVASTEGWVLLLVVAAYLVWLLRTAIAPSHQPDGLQRYAKHQAISSGLTALVGLGLLVIGARWLVDGATSLALTLGISDAVIGLTVVAAGTSLPEVAASLVAAVRGHRDIAVGNILGSNIFNLTIVLGTATVVAGELHVPEGVVTFDLVIMVAVAVACLPIFVTGHTIARWEGALFLAYYAAYTGYLVRDATDHERLPHLRDAMAFFALPLTAVTLLVLAGRALWSQRRADPGPM